MAGDVECLQFHEKRRVYAKYWHTAGACNLETINPPDDQKALVCLLEFHRMVVRDGIDPSVAHSALIAIDEYRTALDGGIRGIAHLGWYT